MNLFAIVPYIRDFGNGNQGPKDTILLTDTILLNLLSLSPVSIVPDSTYDTSLLSKISYTPVKFYPLLYIQISNANTVDSRTSILHPLY